MTQFRFPQFVRPAGSCSPRRRVAAFLLLLSLMLAGGASPVLASPTPAEESDDSEFAEEQDDPRDEAALDSLTADVSRGVRDLGRHYIMGGVSPIPAREPVEFLLLRARHGGSPALKDAALGTVASFASLLLNDYLKWGMPDSSGLAPAGRSIKRASDQAEMVSLFTMALRESGKEMFRRKTTDAARDLAGWCLAPDGSFRSWTSNSPDTTFGGDDPVARWRVAAALTEAAAAIPELWTDEDAARLASRLTRPEAGLTGGQESDPITLRAAHDAAMIAGDPSAIAWLPRLVERIAADTALAPATPVGLARAGQAAWALARYASWTHDGGARREARTILAGLDLERLTPLRQIDLFAGRAAAGLALEFLARPAPMAYIVGDPAAGPTRALARAALAANRPGRLLSVHSPDDPHLLYPPSGDGQPIAYVCSGELCAPPTSSPEEVRALLQTFALPGSEGLLPGFGR